MPIPCSISVHALFLLSILCSIQSELIFASQATPLLLTLSHSLSHSQNQNFTVLHHLKSSALRSAARHGHRRQQQRRRHQVSLPLSPGSDYTLSVAVGGGVRSSPGTTVALYMDTGSDLVWFPCSPFECILCDGKPASPAPPPPPPAGSHLLPCAAAACSAAHSGLPSSDLCVAAACPLADVETESCSVPCPLFYYAYGDGSLVGRLRRGPLSLPAGAPAGIRLQNFTFACAHSALGEPIGVAGFGRGPLSLPGQLASLSPSLAARFSYCLVSHSFKPDRFIRPSPLILGRNEPGSSEPDRSSLRYIYTPLLHNPKHPYFYSVGLEAISIGPNRILSQTDLVRVDRNGNGGMVVDSGTTFTMLPKRMYDELIVEFDRQMKRVGFKQAIEIEERTGFRPCYYYLNRKMSRHVPNMALHFSTNATVVLPRRNYFMGFESGGDNVGCLMMMDGGDNDDNYGGPAGTLGNFQQQGFEVVYDLEKKRVGFVRRQCSTMLAEMSHG